MASASIPPLTTRPLASGPAAPVAALEDWQLVVELLPPPDPDLDVYTPKDIAAPLGAVTPDALHNHIRDIWPEWEGQFRLSREQTIKLIKRYCKFGRRKHTREALMALVEKKRALLQESARV